MKRITIAALGLVVGSTAGCVDMGLDDNIPLEEAENRITTPLVAAVHPEVAVAPAGVVVDGRLWLPGGQPPAPVDPADLRAVGSADGRTVYARSWDRSPYDVLMVEAPSAPVTGLPTSEAGPQYLQLLPVRGRTGPVPGAHGDAGEPAGGAPAPGAH